MEITLELVDQVRERTGCTYEEAKKALEAAKGDVVDAIIQIEQENGKVIDLNEKFGDVTDKVKSAVQKGNVNRIRVLRGDEELVNIPVNAGIAGGVLGVLAGWPVVLSAALAGAVAKYGFNCRFEIVKEDGSVEEIFSDENKEVEVYKNEEPSEKSAEETPEKPSEADSEEPSEADRK